MPDRPSRHATLPRAWQRMLSGRRLDLLDPSPLDIEIADIAHGLARVARWNGQTSGAHIFSVAQHCLLVEAIARFSPAKIEALMQDAGIVRNRAKIEGAVASARAWLDAMEKGPGFSRLLWNFVDGRPKVNRFRTTRQVPAETPLSRAISKELASRGFKFCGPTIVYAFMQAVGMVNDHLVTCHRHPACSALARLHA